MSAAARRQASARPHGALAAHLLVIEEDRERDETAVRARRMTPAKLRTGEALRGRSGSWA